MHSTCFSCGADLGGTSHPISRKWANCDDCASDAVLEEQHFRELLEYWIQVLRNFGLCGLSMPEFRFWDFAAHERWWPGKAWCWEADEQCLYFPIGWSERKVNAMLIGILARVWRTQNLQVFGDNELQRGFAHWVHFHILQMLDFPEEAIQARFKAATRGFRHLLALEERRGRQAVINLARRRATLDLQDWFLVVGRHWRWVLTGPGPAVRAWLFYKLRGVML
ncbi:MAG: hypothetical protein ACYCW6_03435 [Candidatus Xenobia bacterium]